MAKVALLPPPLSPHFAQHTAIHKGTYERPFFSYFHGKITNLYARGIDSHVEPLIGHCCMHLGWQIWSQYVQMGEHYQFLQFVLSCCSVEM